MRQRHKRTIRCSRDFVGIGLGFYRYSTPKNRLRPGKNVHARACETRSGRLPLPCRYKSARAVRGECRPRGSSRLVIYHVTVHRPCSPRGGRAKTLRDFVTTARRRPGSMIDRSHARACSAPVRDRWPPDWNTCLRCQWRAQKKGRRVGPTFRSCTLFFTISVLNELLVRRHDSYHNQHVSNLQNCPDGVLFVPISRIVVFLIDNHGDGTVVPSSAGKCISVLYAAGRKKVKDLNSTRKNRCLNDSCKIISTKGRS